jgi:DNA modification methylase
MTDYRNKIVCGNAREKLSLLPAGVAQTCVTSPPYWGLRDYGAEGQLGLEHTKEKILRPGNKRGQGLPDADEVTTQAMPPVGGKKHKNVENDSKTLNTIHRTRNATGAEFEVKNGLVNRRSVWSIPTGQFKGAHFAVFPNEIPRTCIKAGSREGDLVIDPFMGSGTTAEEAQLLNRDYWGCDLNPKNIGICNKRLHKTFGLFAAQHSV